jgi:TonB family protein
LRIFFGAYLVVYRTTRRPALRSISRYAFACAAACIVTAGLLLALGATVKSTYPDATWATHATSVSSIRGEALRNNDRDDSLSATLDLLRQTPLPAPSRPTTVRAELPTIEPLLAAVSMTPARIQPFFGIGNEEYLPIVKVSPIYPQRAAAQGIEGYVVIEYTVTRIGTVSDVVVIESSSRVFEQSALEAAVRFKYKPRVVGGETVAVSGVRTIIRFALKV